MANKSPAPSVPGMKVRATVPTGVKIPLAQFQASLGPPDTAAAIAIQMGLTPARDE
jgi:hypothetical protein